MVRAFHSGVLRASLYGCIALTSMSVLPVAAMAQDQSGASTATAPDNSGRNKMQHKTAEQQSSSRTDRQLTAKVRKAIVGDSSLSTYAHNVKIITQNGQVTLKGPVHSEEEKIAVASKAAEAAGGQDKVTNQLTVKQ